MLDGEVLDAASYENPQEDDWTIRSVPIPDRGAHRAMLEFILFASGNENYFPVVEAWVDDLRIA